eukprot:8020576-Pyramimonas_sp.AAC.1
MDGPIQTWVLCGSGREGKLGLQVAFPMTHGGPFRRLPPAESYPSDVGGELFSVGGCRCDPSQERCTGVWLR